LYYTNPNEITSDLLVFFAEVKAIPGETPVSSIFPLIVSIN